jgi:hypothetical protein
MSFDSLPADLIQYVYDKLPFSAKVMAAVAIPRIYRLTTADTRDFSTLIAKSVDAGVLKVLAQDRAPIVGNFLLAALHEQPLPRMDVFCSCGWRDSSAGYVVNLYKAFMLVAVLRVVVGGVGAGHNHVVKTQSGSRIMVYSVSDDLYIYAYQPTTTDGLTLYLPEARLSYIDGKLEVSHLRDTLRAEF